METLAVDGALSGATSSLVPVSPRLGGDRACGAQCSPSGLGMQPKMSWVRLVRARAPGLSVPRFGIACGLPLARGGGLGTSCPLRRALALQGGARAGRATRAARAPARSTLQRFGAQSDRRPSAAPERREGRPSVAQAVPASDGSPRSSLRSWAPSLVSQILRHLRTVRLRAKSFTRRPLGRSRSPQRWQGPPPAPLEPHAKAGPCRASGLATEWKKDLALRRGRAMAASQRGFVSSSRTNLRNHNQTGTATSAPKKKV